MKRVFSSESAALAWHIHNMLQHHDIATQVRNDRLYSVAGEVPVHECMAEVWVENALDEKTAERLIRQQLSDDEIPSPSWDCPRCGELNTGEFAACWNCELLIDAIDPGQ